MDFAAFAECKAGKALYNKAVDEAAKQARKEAEEAKKMARG